MTSRFRECDAVRLVNDGDGLQRAASRCPHLAEDEIFHI
jgi:hypothetical protein